MFRAERLPHPGSFNLGQVLATVTTHAEAPIGRPAHGGQCGSHGGWQIASNVIRLLAGQPASLIWPRLVAGALGAAGLSRVFKSLLYQTSPIDPVAFSLRLASLLAVAGIAVFLPAGRTAAVEPMEAVGSEGTAACQGPSSRKTQLLQRAPLA